MKKGNNERGKNERGQELPATDAGYQ